MIRAAVVSDLHLGEEQSMLTFTSLDGQGRPVAAPGEVAWQAMRRELQRLVDENGGRKIPTLILNGDIVELSLARHRLAFRNAKEFFQRLDDAELFDSVVYLPGNHDHFVWRQIVEIERMKHVREAFDDQAPPPEVPLVTPDDAPLTETFLDGVVPCEKLGGVRVAYPNYRLECGGRSFVFHHGHFCEGMWTLVSDLLRKALKTKTIHQLEEFNAPFTDFAWYALGQAGQLSELIERTYEDALAGKFTNIQALGRILLDRAFAGGARQKAGLLERLWYRVLRFGFGALLRLLLRRATREGGWLREGFSPSRNKGLDNRDLARGVARYMSQFVTTRGAGTFVFGHTHCVVINGRIRDPRVQKHTIWNSGGWVAENPVADPTDDAQHPHSCILALRDDASIEARRVRISDPAYWAHINATFAKK